MRKLIKDLKEGDAVRGLGTMVNMTPSVGINLVDVTLQRPARNVTYQWNPEATVEVEETQAGVPSQPASQPGWYTVLNSDLEPPFSAQPMKHTDLENALVWAHRLATQSPNQNFYIVKLATLVYSHPAPPIVEREDFS